MFNRKSGMIKYFWLVIGMYLASMSNAAQDSNTMHLVLNQPQYMPGDTAFFKIYILSDKNRLVSERIIMNLTVSGNGNEQIDHQKFRADNGIGINQWVIRESVKPGKYMLTFYPDWTGSSSSPPLQLRQEIVVGGNNEVHLSSKKDEYGLPETEVNVELIGIPEKIQIRDSSRIVVKISDRNGNPLKAYYNILVRNDQVYDNLGFRNVYVVENNDANYSFKESLTMSGKASMTSGKSIPDSTRIMFYLQKTKWKYQTYLDTAGIVNVWIPDILNEDELYYLAKTKLGKDIPDLKIEWTKKDRFINQSRKEKESLEENSVYADFVLKRNLINRSYQFFENRIDSIKELSTMVREVPSKSLIYLNDYRSFPTMEEFIKEVVSSLKVRKRKSGKIVRVRLKKPITSDPLYVIDGVITKNTDYFLSLAPTEIKSIEVLKDSYLLRKYGLMGQDGVVKVRSIEGDLAVPTEPNSIKIKGLNGVVDFRTGRSNRNIPEIRSTIFWHPNLKTDSKGISEVKIIWTDDTGVMTISIDGITENGKTFQSFRKVEIIPSIN